MKRFVLAITLACALSATTLAGEVPTTGTPGPASGGITQISGITTTLVLTIINLIR